MTFTLLDGGMGQELMARWARPPTTLWSVDVLAERPDIVQAAHADFLAAGADVITLAAYPATPARLEIAGRGEEFGALHTAAIAAAQGARRAVKPEARIAGCLPPLPGSYRANDRLEAAETMRDYDRIVAAQVDGVDLFLCETLASVEEVRLATRAAVRSGLPVWTAATVDEADGERLRSGEALSVAVAAALEEGAECVLVNCSPPEAISRALQVLARSAKTFGAYANGFTTTDPLRGDATVACLAAREDLDPQAYADIVFGWAEFGASVLGGCCEISPRHILEINRRRMGDPNGEGDEEPSARSRPGRA